MSRKSNKIRKENYGPSPIILWILVLILLVALFFLLNSSLFNVSEITVYGTERFSQQDVINASGIDYELNIFQLDEESARQGIESIPYFKVEDIQRTFPTGVKIFVKERHPMAQIGTINGYYIIDAECNALALNSVKDEMLAEVVGVGLMEPQFGHQIVSDSEEKVVGLARILSAINDYSLTDKITKINFENPDSIEIEFLGKTVKIGNSIGCKDKLAVLEKTFDAVKDSITDGKVLNMETEGGYFIG